MAALRRAALALPLLVMLPTLPVAAQHYRWDLSANGGLNSTSGVLKGDALQPVSGGLLDGSSLNFGDTWMYGTQLGYWFSRTFGFRANLSFTESSLEQGDVSLFDDLNVWGGTGDLMIRMIKPRREWSGAEWLPYVALGAGANWVNPAGDNWFTANELEVDFDDDDIEDVVEFEGKSGVPIVCRLAVCAGP